MADDCHPNYAFKNKCSFSAFSNITCGLSAFFPSEREFVQISDCAKDVSGHLRSLKLGQDSIPSEGHLLLLRIGLFSPVLNNFNICPNHRAKLGVKWKRHSVKCSYPDHSHNGKMERPVTPQMSRFILEHKGELVPVGSGICRRCRFELYKEMENSNKIENELPPKCTHPDVLTPIKIEDTKEVNVDMEEKDEIWKTDDHLEIFSDEDSVGLLGSQPSSQSSSWSEENNNTLDIFNKAVTLLGHGKMSPLKFKVHQRLDSLKPSTTRLLKRKATEAVNLVLESIAPGQGNELLKLIHEPEQQQETSSSKLDQLVVKLYCESRDKAVKKRLLSMIACSHTKKQLQQIIPSVTMHAINEARKHAVEHSEGAEVTKQKPVFHKKIDLMKLDHALDFIFNPAFHQVSSVGTKEMRLEDGSIVSIPEVVRTVWHSTLIKLYLAYCEETEFIPLSRSTLFHILQVCPASRRTNLKGLDNITADGESSYDVLLSVVADVEKYITDGLLLMELKECKESLASSRIYMKTDFKMHLKQTDHCSDHCINHALSDPLDIQFQQACTDHQHNVGCDRCQLLPKAVLNLKEILSNLADLSPNTREELFMDIDAAVTKILQWKSHIIRTINQDTARTHTLKDLQPGDILIIMDWAMKFLPITFREKQSDWYGQKGINWHVSVCIYKDENSNLKVLVTRQKMEQSILQCLSTPHRQKVTRQLRKEQVKRYLDHIKQGSVRRERKENRKKTRVEFQKIFLLQEAVESFNDREVARLLNQGVDKNFVTGNDTSLLHKCVEEENYSAAELLIREGVNINAGDVDGWTPLHMACHCQAVDMVQLILNNGGDATRLDVDGFFPHDHAPQDSETREIMQQHMESKGLSEKDLQEVRLKVPLEMFTEVKDHLSHGGNPNKENENGITLLHIACANGYRKVIRLLLKHGADVNQADNDGWTSLHIAARYNQMRVVQTLLRSGADPLMLDSVGCTPSQVTTNNEIRTLLTKAERKQRKVSSWRDSELPDNLDDDADIDADEEAMMGHLVRINSKNVRPRHTTIAKEDKMLELRQREESVNQAQEVIRADDSYVTLGADDTDVTQTVDDVYEEIYVSKLWRNVDESKAQLPPVMESDNLTDLAVISEKSALESIQERFTAGQIYTLIGDILIAVNPFTEMYIYSKEVSQRYHGKSSAPLPPHVYKVAERAHDCMLSTKTSQCCVISGESGAGKTETCKYLIQHLVFIAGSDESNLNSKISQVNPVLEAFGNARTVVNSNSSRFAKFMQLSFNGKGRIVGANLTEFLLEKSRVVLRGEGELSFHIFYWMFSGISPEEANLYHLHDISKHRYLAQAGADVKSRINTNNKEKFWELKQCLQYIGFTSDEIQKILQLLAALLHLGDVTFGSHGNHDAATIANPDKLDLVSEMLEVPSEELGSALVSEFTVTRGEQIRKDRTRQQAGDCRDALAKAVYGRLFSWIVNGINQMIHPIDPSSDKFQIGILDIFGFENFTRNSFEQMCINLANEQMQSYANEYIFMKEQEDCLLEGVPLVELNYKNNQPIIDTFMERNAGILAIIDEESRFPKGTDISLATKLHQGPGEKYPEVYKIPKDKGPSFTVVHYAGVVKYDLIGVLEKNRDTLPNAVLCTMKTSNCLQVKELFQSRMTRTGSLAPSARQQRSRKSRQSPFEFFKKLKGGKSKTKNVTPVVPYEKKGPSTMAYHFKNSLSDLLSRIQAASPHIIRCIRPNIHRTPRHFVPEYVLAQMRYTGIAETIKIKKHGYSARLKFRDFLVVFDTLRTVLVPPYSMISDEQKCREVIKFCGLGSETQSHQVTIGKSKLFFHEADLRKLDQISNKVKEQVIICQSAVRKYLAKKRYAKLQTKSAEENERKVQEFCHQMALQHDKVTSWIQFQRGHDEGRIQNTKKAEKETDLGGSGESLNEILSQYDEVLGKYQDDDDSEEDDSYADVLNLITDMSVQHSRGLPPPPCGAMIMRDNPPPNPKEMYAQAGIYDVIHGEKVSVSSDDAVFLDEHHRPTNQNSPLLSPRLSRSNHHQQHHPQMRRSSSPGQPRQAVPSPNQSRPFSYFSPPSTPSQPPSNTPHLISPGSPTYEPIHQPGHPHNGHHHSTHHQHHRPRVSSNVEVRALSPSRHGQHQRHSAGGSPKSSKRQSMPVKPVAPPQQVRDVNFPQHVSPLNPQHVRDANFPHHVQPLAAHQHSVPQGQETDPSGRRPRAPSFPAPPTPLSGSIRSQGSRRSPSPPLPPPPLQPNVRPMNIRHSTEVIHTRVSEPPTPPPISKIPGTRSSVSSFELGKRSREGSVESPLQSPTHHTGYHGNTDQFSLASQLTQVKLKTGAVPPPQEKTSSKRQAAMGIAAELVLKKTPLRHSPKEAPPKKTPDENREISPEALLKKLNPVKRTEGSKTSPDNETGTAVNFLSKLRPTGGQKPWEKDPSPTLDFADVGMDVMTSSIDEEPLPPEPLVEEEPVEELPLPPPPPTEDSEPVQPKPGVALDTPSTTTNKKRMIFEKEKKDIGDNMDIDLDEVDYNQIPGYVPITNAVPNWKKDMIIKKNEEKVREYVEELRRKKAEALKWKDVPEWKKKMLEKKEQQKREQDSAMTQAAQQKEQAKTAKIKPVLQKRQSFDETQTNNNTTFVTKNPVSSVTKQPVSPPVAKQPEKSPVTKQPESPPVTSMPKNPIKVTNDQREEEERKREARRRQLEMQAQMEKELADVPEWKREIMMKKGGAPTNWGDEREDINRDENNEENQNYE